MNKIANKIKIRKLISELSNNLQEREEIIAVTLLAAIIEESVFFFGPPGTGKSLIARRISEAFSEQKYFEYLMHKFSTPDEIMGPVSLAELKKDNYKRLTEGFLPQATFAFLDEIWKSSPAILNTLLTILNERIFKNGSIIEKVPLKIIIAASNETPPSNQGLEALYDRFLVRINIAPIQNKNNFEILLKESGSNLDLAIDENTKISQKEIEIWKKEISKIELSKETFNAIHILRSYFYEKALELNIYISDRRWKKISNLLKASAFFEGRTKTNLMDIHLLKYCLWSTEENRGKIEEKIEEVIKENINSTLKFIDFDKRKTKLESNIKTEESEIINTELSELFREIKKQEIECKSLIEDFEKGIGNPFISLKNNNFLYILYKKHLEEIQYRRKDCERIISLLPNFKIEIIENIEKNVLKPNDIKEYLREKGDNLNDKDTEEIFKKLSEKL
nr:AAA family ATPase [Fusobacterium gastrosuis]